MNEKKRKLIENGMKLFANKGFHGTSIQEIADMSGVSKGGFYLHFDSKEDLTLHIHQYYYYGLMEEVEAVRKQNLDPKDSLAAQIEVLLQAFLKNKDFITMHMQENVKIHNGSNEFFFKIRQHSFRWARSSLINIYGKQIYAKSIDGAILLEGMIQSYIKWLVIDNLNLDLRALSQFIVSRVDDAINGMLQEECEAQIKPEMLEDQFPEEFKSDRKQMVKEILKHMRDKVDHVDITEDGAQDLYNSLEIMEKEIEERQPKTVLFKGMLTHFKDIPQFKHDIDAICSELGIDPS